MIELSGNVISEWECKIRLDREHVRDLETGNDTKNEKPSATPTPASGRKRQGRPDIVKHDNIFRCAKAPL